LFEVSRRQFHHRGQTAHSDASNPLHLLRLKLPGATLDLLHAHLFGARVCLSLSIGSPPSLSLLNFFLTTALHLAFGHIAAVSLA
jgi:hypothetical protein